MNAHNETQSIKSVIIRSTDTKRCLLMSSRMADAFQTFLKQHIENEVIVINTNIGVEIYYYSAYNYSTLIKNTSSKYIQKHIDTSKLKFRNSLKKEEIHKDICDALLEFVNYPQLFLAYVKKFIYFREKNNTSNFLMPFINNSFEEGLQLIATTKKTPHYDKIKGIKKKFQKLEISNDLMKNLISETLLTKHCN